VDGEEEVAIVTQPPKWWAALLSGLGVRPAVADDWADVFSSVMGRTNWSSTDDLPNFLAQTLHESSYLGRLEENLNYSAERLVQVWPSRFPTFTSAQPYARNPQALADHVYGGRMGNNKPGDGWRYHGRGLIQLTGRDNYSLAERLTGMPLIRKPDLLLELVPALRASVAWWEARVPDSALHDPERVTRYVNGGALGLAERARLTQLARELLAC
jgi:putative chitinase